MVYPSCFQYLVHVDLIVQCQVATRQQLDPQAAVVIYSSLGNLTFRLFFGSSVDLSLETDQRISLRIPDSYRESTLESHQLMILLEGTQ